MFKKDRGNLIRFRELKPLEIDYHYNNKQEAREVSYHESMDDVYVGALNVLKEAQSNKTGYVLFRHGWSTSRRGKTTVCSQIRKLMRSKDATPFIVRRECIQHASVFLAAIRPKD